MNKSGLRHATMLAPNTPEQWQSYYTLRWQILRAPWQQPVGSERDSLEESAVHRMIQTAKGEVVAVGRLHMLPDAVAQIRYMAVDDAWQGQGAGALILRELEQEAIKRYCQLLTLNAREQAIGFYQRLGYHISGEAAPLFGIRHVQMQKRLCLAGQPAQWQQWCQQLADTWQQTIPLSQFMQLRITECNGYQLSCTAPIAPNINLHHTMFAGSIYTLATLTGWGLLYLQLQAQGLSGAQVLADARIRYRKPVSSAPLAICRLSDVRGDLTVLRQGQNARQQLQVEIRCEGELSAEFTADYVVLAR
ncbi:bifunctional GNAT family N-acetyltransferase/hotdog fold thioesterase [Arsukibacterium sp.]|uniref:bifunctional GNAT family N-acetyltransferase/hotdog fold thioesterase n=1 Tax=Arsukibacterium sp. TaxID=1977258 RepID=UPI002FDA6E14